MPLVYPYSRVSSGRQSGADRSGLSRQAEALHRWLASWADYTVAEEIADLGVSAFRGGNQHRNKGLGRWMAAAEAGLIPAGSCLLVEDHRRFSRREPVDALRSVITSIWDAGLGFAVTNYDGGRPLFKADARAQHLALLAFLFEQAHAESQEKSRWSAAARVRERELQDQGIRTPGRAPWWIQRDPATGQLVRDKAGGLVADPEHVRAVRRAVELAIGGLGMSLIAGRLEAEGFSAPPTNWARNGHRPRKLPTWTAGVVSRLLASPCLTGTLQRRDAVVQGYYPRLISDEERIRLRAAVEQRDRMKGRLRGLSYQCRNLFQGVIRCGVCGGPISYSAPAKRSRAGHPGYLSCPASRGKAGRCSNTGSIEYSLAESHLLTRLNTAVWEKLLHRPEDDADRAQLERQVAAHQAELDALRAQLERAEVRAEQMFLAGDDEAQRTAERAIGKLRRAKDQADEQLRHAVQQLDAARARPTTIEVAAQLRERVRTFWARLPEAGPEERTSFGRFLLAREIEFRLHPRPPGGGERTIEMLVRGTSVGTAPLAGTAREVARQRGLVDPATALDARTPDGNLLALVGSREGAVLVEVQADGTQVDRTSDWRSGASLRGLARAIERRLPAWLEQEGASATAKQVRRLAVQLAARELGREG